MSTPWISDTQLRNWLTGEAYRTEGDANYVIQALLEARAAITSLRECAAKLQGRAVKAREAEKTVPFQPYKHQAALNQIEYKDWELRVERDNSSTWFLQWRFMAYDPITDQDAMQSCRKWRLSEHMTRSEAVQTAFAAALAAEEHECREVFRYRGVAVIGPHLNVEDLVGMAHTSEGGRR